MTEGFEPKAGSDSCGLHELLEAFRELAMEGDAAAGCDADDARVQPHDGIVAGSAGPPRRALVIRGSSAFARGN